MYRSCKWNPFKWSSAFLAYRRVATGHFEETCEKDGTHIHHVIKYNKCSTLGLLLITNTNLAYAPVPSEQVVQVLARDLVVQILDKKDPIGTRGKLGLMHV